VAGLAIAVAILAVPRAAARNTFHRLMDAVDPAVVEQIEHAAGQVVGVQEAVHTSCCTAFVTSATSTSTSIRVDERSNGPTTPGPQAVRHRFRAGAGRRPRRASRLPCGTMAAGGTALVGPFPAGADSDEAKDAYDRLRRRVLWTMPSGLYVLGARDGDRLNGMTLNWATQVSDEPKLLAVSVEKPAFTHELLLAGRVFTLNVIDREDRAIVRKFTKPVEVDRAARALNGFPYREGTTGAPILVQAVGYLDCEVRQTVDCGSHTLFLGEIVDAGFNKAEESAVLRMEDTRMNYGG